MNTPATATPGNTTPEDAPQRGRTTVSERALRSLAAAVTAEHLGIEASAVHVTVTVRGESLALSLRSPIALPPLARRDYPAPAATLVERCTDARRLIEERLSSLSGRSIGELDLRISTLRSIDTRRVQ